MVAEWRGFWRSCKARSGAAVPCFLKEGGREKLKGLCLSTNRWAGGRCGAWCGEPRTLIGKGPRHAQPSERSSRSRHNSPGSDSPKLCKASELAGAGQCPSPRPPGRSPARSNGRGVRGTVSVPPGALREEHRARLCGVGPQFRAAPGRAPASPHGLGGRSHPARILHGSEQRPVGSGRPVEASGAGLEAPAERGGEEVVRSAPRARRNHPAVLSPARSRPCTSDDQAEAEAERPAGETGRIGAASPNSATDHSSAVRLSSRSCCLLTGVGASVMRQSAFCVLGKAMTSRIVSDPTSNITIRSSPSAIPPCGGAPY